MYIIWICMIPFDRYKGGQYNYTCVIFHLPRNGDIEFPKILLLLHIIRTSSCTCILLNVDYRIWRGQGSFNNWIHKNNSWSPWGWNNDLVSLMYSICKYKTFVIFYFTSNLPINTCTCMYDFVGYVIYKRRNIC